MFQSVRGLECPAVPLSASVIPVSLSPDFLSLTLPYDNKGIKVKITSEKKLNSESTITTIQVTSDLLQNIYMHG